MASWLSRQIGFDVQGELQHVDAATQSGFHRRPAGRYAAIGQQGKHGGHGHSHGGDDHGHSHGGGGHGEHQEEPLTVESACGAGDLAQVILFFAQGVDLVNRCQPYGGAEAPPLMWAALKGHLPIVKFLVDRGVNIHQGTRDGQNALQWAATEGRYDVVDALLALGAQPAAADIRGYNAYFVAVQASNLAMLVLLTDHTPLADPNVRDADGHALMHWAAYRGSLALCQYLHEILGVAIDGLDNHKRTPLIWAAREGFDDVCAYLLSKGARAQAQDVDELSALKHAQDRNQRNVVLVLNGNLHEVATRRRAGTLSIMVMDRAALLAGLFGMGYVMVAFAAMLFLPSICTHLAFGMFFGKNLLFATLFRMPANHKSQQSNDHDLRKIASASGIAKSFAEAVQSLDYTLRRREPANLFAILTFLAVQNVSLLSAEIDLSFVYWGLLAVVLGSMWWTKFVAMKSVVPSGTIHDSATVRIARDKKFGLLQSRIVDQEKHIQVPLRAFYCHEIDEIVRLYDSYSVALDAPIGEANLAAFTTFTIAFAWLQLYVFWSSWHQLHLRLCEPVARSGMLWGFLFHALPCAIAPADDSWFAFVFPSSLNSAGIWVIQYALAAFVMGAIVVGRTVMPFAYGCTRREMLNPTAPTADGELVPIVRHNRSIFSEGGAFTNLLLLFVGRFGQRWRGLYVVPAPPSP